MRRDFQLKRGVIDLDTGVFPVTLFTNGEAADGHIINVEGLQADAQVPMFVNHLADPTLRMGSLSNPVKDGKAKRIGGQRLRMTARIDMEGDSHAADIRRDVAQGIALGDITGMSGRWDPIGEPQARSGLSKSHYAFSEAGAGAFNAPLYFAEARVLEGSIVGVPSDSAALIGRANDIDRPEHVREFYRELSFGDPVEAMRRANDLESQLDEIRGELEELQLARSEETEESEAVDIEAATVEESRPPADQAARTIEQAVSLVVSSGIPEETVAEMVRLNTLYEERQARRITELLTQRLGLVV